MGRLTVLQLLRGGANVTILNRGKTANPFQGWERVTHLVCDRINDRARFRRILSLGANVTNAMLDTVGPAEKGDGDGEPKAEADWDGVVDFVCFRPPEIDDVIRSSDSIRHYIFISTDSVFMAASPSHLSSIRREHGLQEEDAVPCESKEEEEHTRARDAYQSKYGGNKLRCEQRLFEAKSRFGRFTILRLPDVIGPYDNLGSHLDLQSAILRGKSVRTCAPGEAKAGQRKLSFAFGPDVANAVVAVLQKANAVWGETLHVACREQVPFREYVTLVSKALKQDAREREGECAMITTDTGPLCIDKALASLDWSPTPLEKAVSETVLWYQNHENQEYTQELSRSSSSSSSSSSASSSSRSQVPVENVGDVVEASDHEPLTRKEEESAPPQPAVDESRRHRDRKRLRGGDSAQSGTAWEQLTADAARNEFTFGFGEQ